MGMHANNRTAKGLPAYEHPKTIHEMLLTDPVLAPYYMSYLSTLLNFPNRRKLVCADLPNNDSIRDITDGVYAEVNKYGGYFDFSRRMRQLLHVKSYVVKVMASADLEFVLVRLRDERKLSKKMKLPNKIEQAMDVVMSALNKDPDYYIGWQANIAVAFQDAYAAENLKRKPTGMDIHHVSNVAAREFLDRLKFVPPERNLLDEIEHGSHLVASEEKLREIRTVGVPYGVPHGGSSK